MIRSGSEAIGRAIGSIVMCVAAAGLAAGVGFAALITFVLALHGATMLWQGLVS